MKNYPESQNFSLVVLTEMAQTLMPAAGIAGESPSSDFGSFFKRHIEPGCVAIEWNVSAVSLPSGRVVTGHKLRFTTLEEANANAATNANARGG